MKGGTATSTTSWRSNWGGANKGTTSSQSKPATSAFNTSKTGFSKPASTSLDIRTSGIKLPNSNSNDTSNDTSNDNLIDTINDLSVNDHFVVAAASWSGLKIWRNVPKVESTPTQSNFTGTPKQIPYSFELIDEDLMKNGFMFRNPESPNAPEPIIRCTFDTLQNNIIYYGNVWGQIFKVCIEEAVRDQQFGHQKSMITGLKYCRDKRAIASSSTDGKCFLWDPRKGPYQCAEVVTGINCTNLDFVQNTIGICGISDCNPVVKLYDIRNLTNPLPPPKPTTYSFSKQTSTTTTTATTPKFTSNLTQKPPYSEIKSFALKEDKENRALCQFTSIVLDRSGTNFVAGTIGGYIISSKTNQAGFDMQMLIKHKSRTAPAQNTGFTKNAQQSSADLNENLKFKAINSLAMIQAPIRANGITAHAIFAGTSCGSLVTLTGFRSYEKQGNNQQDSIKVINYDYVSANENPVTAVAVSPNGKYLAYAYGDDYREGSKYRFSFNEGLKKKTEAKVKLVIVNEDFKVKEGKI